MLYFVVHLLVIFTMPYVSTLIIQKAVDFHFFERLASKYGRINCHVFISFSYKYFLCCTNIVIEIYIRLPVFLSKWIRWQKIYVQLFGYVHDTIPNCLERPVVRNSDISRQIWWFIHFDDKLMKVSNFKTKL